MHDNIELKVLRVTRNAYNNLSQLGFSSAEINSLKMLHCGHPSIPAPSLKHLEFHAAAAHVFHAAGGIHEHAGSEKDDEEGAADVNGRYDTLQEHDAVRSEARLEPLSDCTLESLTWLSGDSLEEAQAKHAQ